MLKTQRQATKPKGGRGRRANYETKTVPMKNISRYNIDSVSLESKPKILLN